MKFNVFDNNKSLVDYAYKFLIEERLPSLQKDVEACLNEHCAFPALLYCFSTIDLLGALYKGNATESSKTRGNFKEYARRFMKNGGLKIPQKEYSDEHIELLQDIFRHKIVHLAQPKLIINRDERRIAWRYEYPDTSNHLKIVNTGRKKTEILTPYDMFYDHVFIISITQLMYDIVDSVIRYPDGYFSRLKSGYKMSLRKNFDDAIEQIYDADN